MKMLINVYTIEIVKNLNDLVIAANARSYINIEGYVIVTGYKIDRSTKLPQGSQVWLWESK